MSSHAAYGHGQDVGIQVHIFVFFVLLVLVGVTELIPLDTAVLLSVSTGRSAFNLLANGLRYHSIGLSHVLAQVAPNPSFREPSELRVANHPYVRACVKKRLRRDRNYELSTDVTQLAIDLARLVRDADTVEDLAEVRDWLERFSETPQTVAKFRQSAALPRKSRALPRQTATTRRATRIPIEISAKRCHAAVHGPTGRDMRTTIASVTQA